MAKLKALLPYIFGLVSLMISLGVVSQVKPTPLEKLPYPTPTATPLPKAEPFPGAARIAHCKDLSQPRFFFYAPNITAESRNALTLSGTVYSSNLTPLPDALVEIWQSDTSQVNHPYPPIIFGGRRRTDGAGHYELTTTKFTSSGRSFLHYRVTYRNYCPLEMYLHLVIEPRPKPAEHIVTKVEITGPVLQGPVNIVIPVPPLEPR